MNLLILQGVDSANGARRLRLQRVGIASSSLY
jgi:hypothetical protein